MARDALPRVPSHPPRDLPRQAHRAACPCSSDQRASVDVATFGPIDADRLPWMPDVRWRPGGTEWCWGSAPVRRMAAVLITWINAVARAASPSASAALYAAKHEVSRVRAEAERISPSVGAFETDARGGAARRRRWLRPTRSSGAATLAHRRRRERRPRRSPRSTTSCTPSPSCITTFVERARSTIEEPVPDTLDRLRPSPRCAVCCVLHDGAAQPADLTRFLLSVEVLEATFAGTEPRPDQAIRLVQFTSQGAVTIDELQRSSPVEKLAGVELAHFGAFLKRSWRANDWMWGRLDAVRAAGDAARRHLRPPVDQPGHARRRTLARSRPRSSARSSRPW